MYKEYEACPLCEANEGRDVCRVDCTRHPSWRESLPAVLEWVQCGRCEHVYTKRYWSAAGLAEIFKVGHEHQVASMAANHDTSRGVWAPTVERAIEALGGYRALFSRDAKPKWFDVGCGSGSLIMTAGDFGFAAAGIDARPETAALLKKLELDVVVGGFDELPIGSGVDVLSMMDVLEHVPFPKRTLEKAAEALRPGGLIVISMPDRECSTWRLLDALGVNPYWMELEHHHNFGRSKLISVLQASGFEPVGFGVPLRYRAQMEVYALRRG